jgi:hypothetical protein
MQRSGYALAFLIVLLAACAGAFFGGRILWRQLQGDFGPRSWAPPDEEVAQVTGAPQAKPAATATPGPRPTATRVSIVTPAAPVVLPAFTPDVAGAEATALANAQATASPTASATPQGSPTPSASPTVPAGDFPFYPSHAVRNSSGDCPGAYVLGRVVDRAGNPMAGLVINLSDEYGNQESKVTKGGADAGRYDFPLFGPPRRFYVMVMEGGKPASQQVEVPHGVGSQPQASCHWVDWQRR